MKIAISKTESTSLESFSHLLVGKTIKSVSEGFIEFEDTGLIMEIIQTKYGEQIEYTYATFI